MEIHIGDRVAEIELVSKEDNKVVLTIDGKPFEADVVRYRHRHRSHENAEQLQSDFRLPHQGNSGSGRRQHHR